MMDGKKRHHQAMSGGMAIGLLSESAGFIDFQDMG
jgi:hypothetical protein